MLSKCANPACSKTFLYLRQGKLFRLEVSLDNDPETDTAASYQESSTSRLRHEYFWLCESCSRTLQVISENGSRL
jgi:hypothetical protein